MTGRIDKNGLQVDPELVEFIEGSALPGTDVGADVFWAGLSDLVHDLGPKNRALLEKRAELQAQIDDWHRTRAGQPHDAESYTAFLREIGYLLPEGPDFQIETQNVDPEDRAGARATACGADHQCSFRAERRQCALGEPL